MSSTTLDLANICCHAVVERLQQNTVAFNDFMETPTDFHFLTQLEYRWRGMVGQAGGGVEFFVLSLTPKVCLYTLARITVNNGYRKR